MSGRRAPRPPKRLADYDVTSVRCRSRSRFPASDVSPSGGGTLVELEEQTRTFQTPAAPSQASSSATKAAPSPSLALKPVAPPAPVSEVVDLPGVPDPERKRDPGAPHPRAPVSAEDLLVSMMRRLDKLV
jgi:hypothetical protein